MDETGPDQGSDPSLEQMLDRALTQSERLMTWTARVINALGLTYDTSFEEVYDLIRRLAEQADLNGQDFLDANEKLGCALVQIGLAAGLPRPTTHTHMSSTTIIARVAELREYWEAGHQVATTTPPLG